MKTIWNTITTASVALAALYAFVQWIILLIDLADKSVGLMLLAFLFGELIIPFYAILPFCVIFLVLMFTVAPVLLLINYLRGDNS